MGSVANFTPKSGVSGANPGVSSKKTDSSAKLSTIYKKLLMGVSDKLNFSSQSKLATKYGDNVPESALPSLDKRAPSADTASTASTASVSSDTASTASVSSEDDTVSVSSDTTQLSSTSSASFKSLLFFIGSKPTEMPKNVELMKEAVSLFQKENPKTQITEAGLRDFLFSKNDNKYDSIIGNRPSEEFSIELSQSIELEAGNPDQNQVVLDGLLARLHKEDGEYGAISITNSAVKERLIQNIEAASRRLADTGGIGMSLMNSINKAIGNPKIVDAMATLEKQFGQLENKTEFTSEQLGTLERNAGLEFHFSNLASDHNGQTQNFSASLMNLGASMMPGAGSSLTAKHVDELRDDRANSGTFNADVRETIPKFSESESWGSGALKSVADAVIKTPLRLALKAVTFLMDGLSGVAVGVSRKLLGKGDFKATLSNRGATRKSLVRKAIQYCRTAQNNLSTLKDKMGVGAISKESALIKKMNATRIQLAESKDPERRNQLLSDLRTYNNDYKIEIDQQDRNFTETHLLVENGVNYTQKSVSEIQTALDELDAGIEEKLKDAHKTQEKPSGDIQSTTVHKMLKDAEDGMAGAEDQLGVMLRYLGTEHEWLGVSEESKVISRLETRRAALQEIMDQKNKYVTQSLAHQNMATGIDNMEGKLSSPQPSISNALDQILDTSLPGGHVSVNAQNVLKDIRLNPEYYDTTMVSSEVLNELKGKSQPVFQTVVKFIEDNRLKGQLRQKDTMVLNSCMVHAMVEYGASAVGGGVGPVHKLISAAAKTALAESINIAAKSQNSSQFNINQEAASAASDLGLIEADIFKSLGDSGDEGELKEFISEKQKMDEVFLGTPNWDSEDGTEVEAHSKRQLTNNDYPKKLDHIRQNKALLKKYEDKINEQVQAMTDPAGKMRLLNFQSALKSTNPNGAGLAEAMLLPSHRTQWSLKKFSASNLGA